MHDMDIHVRDLPIAHEIAQVDSPIAVVQYLSYYHHVYSNEADDDCVYTLMNS